MLKRWNDGHNTIHDFSIAKRVEHYYVAGHLCIESSLAAHFFLLEMKFCGIYNFENDLPNDPTRRDGHMGAK